MVEEAKALVDKLDRQEGDQRHPNKPWQRPELVPYVRIRSMHCNRWRTE